MRFLKAFSCLARPTRRWPAQGHAGVRARVSWVSGAFWLGLGWWVVGWPLAQAQPAALAPVKIWVGAPAGGTTDTMARAMSQALAEQWGRPVVVENRPGAGGNLAAETVARSQPDGLNLLMS